MELSLTLRVLPQSLCLCRLPPDAPLPGWATRGGFFSITRSAEELSIVCEERQARDFDGLQDRGWRAFQLVGKFDFSAVGILTALALPLTRAEIPFLAVATYDTDYLLVKDAHVEAAQEAWLEAGHEVLRALPSPFDYVGRAKPILKWAGGKSGPLHQILGRFPDTFGTYYEPFLGGGAVFFALREGHPSVLNDCNRELVELYEVIRDDVDALCLSLDALFEQYSEDFYYQLRTEIPDGKVPRAARTVFLNKTGFNGLFRLNAKGQFNVPFGKRKRCPRLYDRENLNRAARRLRTAELTQCDFETVIDRAGAGDLVYCDPPYEPVSRTAAFTGYTEKGFSQEEQRRLERACRRAVDRGARIAISNSSAPFILDLYREGWRVDRIEARRAINSKGNRRGTVEEVLVLG